mmetsp:Transcript_31897/g.42407  ORF Transcript_31897/g.42407 Transcript_31897/m.42407 type:complete len:98 (-) Transcript_31897:661-954(-)|eukprot:9215905-Ditylum_brightwellii.AAC.1
MLSSLLQWAGTGTSNNNPDDVPSRHLSMLPWIVWGLDQMENSAHLFCLLNFDEHGPDVMWSSVASVGSIANVSKWLLFGVSILSFIVLAARRKPKTD